MKKGTTIFLHSDEQYRAAIKDSHGNLSLVARRLGIDRNSVAAKMKNHPELMELVNSERDTFIDLAEDRLHSCVEKNSLPAIMFTLKTIGKARGWGESQEIILSKGQDEREFDISVLTEEERVKLDELTAKIYKPLLIEEETSES